MALNIGAFRTTNGQLKLLSVVLIGVVLTLARAGDGGKPLTFGMTTDHSWLLIVTVGAYAIIYSAFMVTYLSGYAIDISTEALYTLLGSILFLASGIMTIRDFEYRGRNVTRSSGIALGSLSIITGIIMAVDFLLLSKRIYIR